MPIFGQTGQLFSPEGGRIAPNGQPMEGFGNLDEMRFGEKLQEQFRLSREQEAENQRLQNVTPNDITDAKNYLSQHSSEFGPNPPSIGQVIGMLRDNQRQSAVNAAGGDKSNPWKTLLPLLLPVASIFIPPLLGAMFPGAAAGAGAAGAAGAGAGAGGGGGASLAMNAVAPELSQTLASGLSTGEAGAGGGGMGFLSDLFSGIGNAVGGAANSIGGAANSIGSGLGDIGNNIMNLFQGGQGGQGNQALPNFTNATLPFGSPGRGGTFQTQPNPMGGPGSQGGGYQTAQSSQQSNFNPFNWLTSLFTGGGGGSPPPNPPGMGSQSSTNSAMQALQNPLESILAQSAGLPGGGVNQLTQQQLQNSPYQQGQPGFGQAPSSFWNILQNLIPGNNQSQSQSQPQPQQPQQQQTGINTGGDQPTDNNWINNLFGGIGNALGGENGIFQNIPSALAGGGVLGIGELMNKPINMPNFADQPQVKALTDWSNTANHPLDPNVRESIQNTLNIQNEQQLRNLRDVYKNARPGSDYTTDSAYQRDLERLNRNMSMTGADAMGGAQLASNQQQIGNLGNLAQLGVGQNLGQAGIEAQRQRSRNQMFGNIGSMLGYKGIFGNKGPGLGMYGFGNNSNQQSNDSVFPTNWSLTNPFGKGI